MQQRSFHTSVPGFERWLYPRSIFGIALPPSMRTEAISSCVARCGPEGVKIIILASSFHEDLFTFALRIAEEAYLWRRFELVCKDLYPDHIINLTNLRLGTLGVDAPPPF